MARQTRPDAGGARNKGGRPRLIDQPCPASPGQTYAEAIIECVRLGVPLSVAARSSGIGVDTLGDWRARGRGTSSRDDPDGRFARFVRDCDAAEAESVATLVLALREAVIGDPYEIVRTVTKQVRDEDGTIRPLVEQTVTRGTKRYPRTAEWLLQRRAPEFFGAQAAGQLPAPGPAGGEVPPEEAQVAAQRQWDAYLQGIRDGEANRVETAAGEGP